MFQNGRKPTDFVRILSPNAALESCMLMGRTQVLLLKQQLPSIAPVARGLVLMTGEQTTNTERDIRTRLRSLISPQRGQTTFTKLINAEGGTYGTPR